MKPLLHEVTGKNRHLPRPPWPPCWASALRHAAALIRQQSGQVAVKSTNRHHLAQALRSAGCSVYLHVYPTDERPTMAQWLKLKIASVPHFKANQHVIVNFRNHYGTVLGRRYLCSQTRRQTVSHSEIPGRCGRVTGYLVVSKLPHAAPVEPRPDTSGQASGPPRGARPKPCPASTAAHSRSMVISCGSSTRVCTAQMIHAAGRTSLMTGMRRWRRSRPTLWR